jgi:hypothetical protein
MLDLQVGAARTPARPSGVAMTPMTVAGQYVHWGVVNVSVTNLLIIGAMLIVFVLALLVPFPKAHEDEPDERGRS